MPDPKKLLIYWDVVKQRIEDRTSDPIRLFVKPEPHLNKKIEEGRFRLISSVSIVDQIIDHMLFDPMNDLMVSNWPLVPPKVGWSEKWGGWKIMPRKTWLAIDKSSWDWTVQSWMIDIIFELRKRLCANLSDTWVNLAQWRYEQLYVCPVFVTSGGLYLRQVHPGVMKSGCVNTISDNSIMQVLLHHRVCFELGIKPGNLMSMGDDTLQEIPDDLEVYLERLGSFCKVKQAIKANEFAGMRFFPSGRIEPLYKGKHAFILLHVLPEILPDLAMAYTLLYHRSSYRNLMENVFLEMGQKVPSRAIRDCIMDGY